MQKPNGWEDSQELLSLGKDMAIVPMNSQLLWFPTQSLHETRPVNILSCVREGFMGPGPSLRSYGGESTSLFSMV